LRGPGLQRGLYVPQSLCRRKDLTPRAKLIYAALLAHQGAKDCCYPSIRLLALETGSGSTSAIVEAISALRKLGYVEVLSSASGSVNHYKVRLEPTELSGSDASAAKTKGGREGAMGSISETTVGVAVCAVEEEHTRNEGGRQVAVSETADIESGLAACSTEEAARPTEDDEHASAWLDAAERVAGMGLARSAMSAARLHARECTPKYRDEDAKGVLEAILGTPPANGHSWTPQALLMCAARPEGKRLDAVASFEKRAARKVEDSLADDPFVQYVKASYKGWWTTVWMLLARSTVPSVTPAARRNLVIASFVRMFCSDAVERFGGCPSASASDQATNAFMTTVRDAEHRDVRKEALDYTTPQRAFESLWPTATPAPQENEAAKGLMEFYLEGCEGLARVGSRNHDSRGGVSTSFGKVVWDKRQGPSAVAFS